MAVNSDINVTPLVDVMLVLLIIFMVITPLLQKGVNVQLAPTQNPLAMPDADKTDAVIVAISRDGKLFLGNKVVSQDDLTDKVKDLISNKLDKTVYIKADARARFGNVSDAVDAVRAAGVDNVAMLTEKVNSTGQMSTMGGAGGGGK
jgi:biopolymer transport protein ExbD/biopolymer transport protein TolR